jgi:hypothetical protein
MEPISMQLPDFLAKPIFHIVFGIINRRRGGPRPPLRRVVRPVDEARRQAFDALLDEALAGDPQTPIHYNLPYPKSEFHTYVCDWRGVVAHGSPLKDLAVLEPVRKSHDSSEFGNRQQIFCSPDALWAMWFAILDKDLYRGTNNACIRSGSGNGRVKYYYFQLPVENKEDPPYTAGAVYLCRPEDFPDKHIIQPLPFFNAEVEQWGSAQPVKPLARIGVKPWDFPYLGHVQYCLK